MFDLGNFTLSSGAKSTFKIECDDLTDSDIEALAAIIAENFQFSNVVSVPTGGDRLAKALQKYVGTSGGWLIVDDVLTTGQSMEKVRVAHSTSSHLIKGVVIFSRTKDVPKWITPIFTFNLRKEGRGKNFKALPTVFAREEQTELNYAGLGRAIDTVFYSEMEAQHVLYRWPWDRHGRPVTRQTVRLKGVLYNIVWL
jgi:hypothetical protein